MAESSSQTTSRPSASVVLLVVLLAFLAHGSSLGGGFVHDDPRGVERNPVAKGSFAPGAWFANDFWGLPPGTGPGTWRPLPLATFWLDHAWGGGQAWAFHLTNVALHALAAVALLLALHAHTARPRVAWASAAIFAVMAVGTEAVNGIVGRADIMAAGLGFLAWRLEPRSGAPAHPGRSAGAALVFFAALLCKETASALLLWLPLADRLLAPRGAAPRLLSTRYLSLFAAFLAYLGLRVATGFAPDATLALPINNPLLDEGLPVRLLTSLALLAKSLRLILVPLGLTTDYGFAQILPERSPFSLPVLAGFALLAALLALALGLARRERVLALGITLFLVPWLAISNVIVPLPTIFAERLLYAPAAGVAIVLGWLAERAGRRRPALATALLIPVIVGNAVLATARAADWRNDTALKTAAVRISTRSAQAWINYGVALVRAGRDDEALAAAERAFEIAPEWVEARRFRRKLRRGASP